MAVIQKLRDKYAKLTGGIIVVALLGFIFMDLGRGGGRQSTTIGKINGEKIDMTVYNDRIKQQEEQYKQQTQGQPLSADQEAQLRDQVWQQLVAEQVMADMNKKLGVTITEAELNNYLTGPNPDPLVRQQFTNPKTGVFNPQEVSVQIQQIKNDPNQKEAWDAFMNNIKERHLNQKVSDLLTGSLYVPGFVVDNQVQGMTEVVNAQTVKIPYATIADKDANVSDKDINAYIQAHKAAFEVPKTTRNIEYVSFNVIPSSEDSAKVLKALDTLKNAFATTTDVEAFVNHNGQNATPPQYYTAQQLKPLSNSAELMSAAPNQVVGPFYDGNGFDLARILEKKSLPDSVRTRHILVFIKQGDKQILSDSVAKSRIDSAIAALNAGIGFDTVAAKYSDDRNSQNGGNEGQTFTLTQKQSLSGVYGEDFSNFIFNGATGQGKLLKVELDNYTAYNYVQILHQSAPVEAVKIAFLSRELIINDKTNTNIYNKATQFAAQIAAANGKKTFDQVATENGLRTTQAGGIDQNSYLVNNLGSASDLVKWVYDENTKIGDVSPVFSVNGKFIIAKLAAIQPKGLLQINDQNRDMLKAMVMKEKKAKIILDKYKSIPASLAALSQQAQQPVNSLDSIRFAQSFVPGLGNELKVIGYAFNPDFKLNTVSPAIAGSEGVYFISVTGKGKTALPVQATPAMMKQRLTMNLKQSAGQSIMSSMIENADVKDMRSNIY
ncbi:MAG TPA: peptidylprolyl isomerase [Edaphocola sp.]|nr:peptidylprolyl isomerase [Edaphocola sp.]